ncbi:MAG TPA: DUF3341 domain-containing protein [Pelomicrobium sp.]|nr:DUF3341 domain-containing protein [Pelomicrobium sp.]
MSAGRYGLAGRFADADALLAAARLARSRYPRLEAYAPFPVDGLAEATGLRASGVRWFALAGGVFGGVSGFLVQWYTLVIDYPINVGGRPLESWPAFVPIAFILTLLWTGVGAVAGLLALSRLPRLHHPAFGVPDFEEASRAGFFLLVRADGAAFAPDAVRALLRDAGALAVDEVDS